jgi:pimeloyl-ACP methyl ester carboxylesterase
MPRLYLVPGLGADERLFAPQTQLPLDVRVLPWLPPQRGEDLGAYAARMAGRIDRTQPFVLAGVSFGGVVAMEIAQAAPPRALVLISSCRTPAAIPAWYRGAWAMSSFCPPSMLKAIMLHSPLTLSAFEPLTDQNRRLFMDMLEQACPEVVAAGMAMLMRWRGTNVHVPIHQVHGECDGVLPASMCRADCMIPGAGHLANLTHAPSVNAYLMSIMANGVTGSNKRR